MRYLSDLYAAPEDYHMKLFRINDYICDLIKLLEEEWKSEETNTTTFMKMSLTESSEDLINFIKVNFKISNKTLFCIYPFSSYKLL